MSPWILFVLGAAAGISLVAHFALFLVAYAPVRRRLGRLVAGGQVNPQRMAAFQENNIGIDPKAAYLYALFDVGPDEVLRIRGRLDPEAPYASMTLYDTYLQGFPGRTGPTHLNHSDLHLSADGRFEITLAHSDPGTDDWLDLSGQMRGMVAWRQGEGEVELPTLERRPAEVRVANPRLTGVLSWRGFRAVYVGWMAIRTLVGWDFLQTLATGQDAADFVRFEDLGAVLDRDHSGRRLHLEGRPTPGFDMERPFETGTLGAHVHAHFAGPAQDIELSPTRFPLSPRGTWAKDRWRHMHDLRHVLLGLGTSLPEELVLHGFQLGQHPTWSGALIVGIGFPLGVLHGVSPWRLFRGIHTALGRGRQARLVVAMPVEDWVDDPIDAVRLRLGILPMGQLYGANGPFYPAERT